MEISVIIPTHNQQERLRLVLCGLRRQRAVEVKFEVIVVDDGCTDGTALMLADVAQQMPLKIVRLQPNQGRCRARNDGVQHAVGRLVAFLDGDALPHPDWLSSHWRAYQRYGPDCLLCGSEYSLADLEYFQDPQTGTLMEGLTPSVVRTYLRQRRAELIVTEAQIETDFAGVEARACEGGYPFPELQQVQQQTRELCHSCPASPLTWIGFYPHNGMVRRDVFEQVGGFDAEIPFCEGWDLAYRLQQAGLRPCFVDAARTYHLYHYHDFSDPAKSQAETRKRRQALDAMAQRYADPRLVLVHFWLGALWPDPLLPEETLLPDLLHLDQAYRELDEAAVEERQRLLQRHPLWGLGVLNGKENAHA